MRAPSQLRQLQQLRSVACVFPEGPPSGREGTTTSEPANGLRGPNTARGSVLDEDALYDALSGGRLAGAALDVYQHEPYRPQSSGRDLRTLPNILLTPHLGSNTVEANEAMARAALANVARFLHGRIEELTRVDQ